MENKRMELAVNSAKTKLARHRELGDKSLLNIMEVANLMDLVTFGPNASETETKTIFFSYNMN